MADAKNNFDVRYVQRGEQHSAAFRRQQAEARLEPGTDYSMPRNQHADQSLDFSGVFRASAHVPIPSDNRGYVMLQKMGWAGSGLGRNLTGRTVPVDLEALAAGSQQGLGRAAHEGELIAAETASRRQLAAEAQLHEDEGAREQRRQRAAAQAATQATVKAMTRDFYCEVCAKQYRSVVEMDEHLSSYDHHHTKRLKEARAAERARTRDKRERQEAKRAAREQARLDAQIAAAHGSGTAAPALPSMPAATPSPAVAGSSGAAAHSEPVHADTGWHASDAARHSTPAKRSRWDARPAPTPASASVHNAQAGAASTGDPHNDPQPPLPPEDEPNVAAGWVQQHQPTSAGALAGARPMQPAQHARQASTQHAASNGTAFGQSAHRWASSAPLLPGSPLPPQSGDASGPKQPLQQHHAARHDVAHEWAGPAAWHSRAKPPSASGLGFSMGAQNPDRPLDTHLASQVAQATAGVAAQDAPQAPKQAVVQAKKGRMASMFGGSDDDD